VESDTGVVGRYRRGRSLSVLPSYRPDPIVRADMDFFFNILTRDKGNLVL
jgi:hypothetical protein